MKILMLNYEFPPIGGGGAAVCRELCDKLSEHGHSIDVVTMGYKGLPALERQGNVIIRRVRCWRTQDRVCHPWEQLTYCLSAYIYISRQLNVKSYDFVHAHFIIPTGLLALCLKHFLGIPYMLTAHGSDVLGHNKKRFSILYRIVKPLWKIILSQSRLVTAPSDYLIDKIHASYPMRSIELVPNGINVADYCPGEKKKFFITLTRLQESKGVQDLLRACAEIDMHGWNVYILGDGPYRQQLEQMSEKLGLAGRIVHFKGHVTGEARLQYLAEAGGFFSGSQFEAFSLSVLEASLCGCNIVASRIEPHITLVGKEHTYSNFEELKRMLADVTAQSPGNIDYGNRSYDWEYIYKIYEKQYRKMINE